MLYLKVIEAAMQSVVSVLVKKVTSFALANLLMSADQSAVIDEVNMRLYALTIQEEGNNSVVTAYEAKILLALLKQP